MLVVIIILYWCQDRSTSQVALGYLTVVGSFLSMVADDLSGSLAHSCTRQFNSTLYACIIYNILCVSCKAAYIELIGCRGNPKNPEHLSCWLLAYAWLAQWSFNHSAASIQLCSLSLHWHFGISLQCPVHMPVESSKWPGVKPWRPQQKIPFLRIKQCNHISLIG